MTGPSQNMNGTKSCDSLFKYVLLIVPLTLWQGGGGGRDDRSAPKYEWDNVVRQSL
jgi:hypothetical protein